MKNLFIVHPEYWTNFSFSNRTHSFDSKKKMSEKAKLRTGEKNSSFGSVWIYNETLRKNKKVKKDVVSSYINQGWIIGRKMEYYHQ